MLAQNDEYDGNFIWLQFATPRSTIALSFNDYTVRNEKLAKPDKIFNFMYIQLHYMNILDSHKIVYFPDRVVVKTNKLTE